jgi:hypothetical protein
MGKSSTPMRILITDSSLCEHPEFKQILEDLIAQGHTIDTNDDLSKYHFIAGPNCWYCVPQVAQLFQLALKQGRVIAGIEKKALPKKDKPIKTPKVKKPKKSKQLKGDEADDSSLAL